MLHKFFSLDAITINIVQIRNVEDELPMFSIYDYIVIKYKGQCFKSIRKSIQIREHFILAEFSETILPAYYDVQFVPNTYNFDFEELVLHKLIKLEAIKFLFPTDENLDGLMKATNKQRYFKLIY